MAEPQKKPDDATPAQRVEEIPDPDEDDLDDLDDVLDEFSATKLDDKPAAPAPANPAPAPAAQQSAAAPTLSAEPTDDDFAKQLQAGMAALLGDMGNSPEMQQQFESLLKELESEAPSAAAGQQQAGAESSATGASDAGASKGSGTKAGEDSFQEQIRKTMERMATSGQQADEAAAAKGDSADDILASMLAEMERGGFGGEGVGSDEDFSKMLMGMMEHLTNKDILYEPMKELDDKFPAWMEKNREKVKKEDLKRYEEQKTLVREITARFEAPGYSDDNPKDREYIVERMQKMQAAGSPPPDLVGDMSAAQEALGEMDSGCAQQ
ncbi:uncharacterized protein K452DRAFT_226694 [Aplosporella prunicola CBS 121167]|uniref:Pex19-domain-containing protein n=1 Tax=Aplosporella prunicola CBS 121167 TaxID=1176127 RepID=A0A6A6BFL4_9PEZI|nr:uncharacterized protein K452DRAFT_226694 [Aplosporella prunicola CBS 121167]KAF2142348.1 hypothetical protein K452DRAFT_226694 [Aplosporella prunicola CBS 121167]